MEVSYFLWLNVEFEIAYFSLIFLHLNFFFFFQTTALCGTALFLALISYWTLYEASLFCLACAVARCRFHSSGILINPQDIAPKHTGSVSGMFVWILLLFSEENLRQTKVCWILFYNFLFIYIIIVREIYSFILY